MPQFDVREHFPFDSYRPGQERAIQEALDAFEGGVENVIIEGATGVGKTPIIITIARYLTRMYSDVRKRVEYMLNSQEVRADAIEELAPHQAHLITMMKMLQRQYLNDDKDVVLMMGKSNYPCESRGRKLNCQDSEAIYRSACRKCVYRDARTVAQQARLTLHNCDSFLNQAALGQSFTPRGLLCVDEAHDLEEKIISFVQFGINDSVIDRMFPQTDFRLSGLTEDGMREKMGIVTSMFEDRKLQLAEKMDFMSEKMRNGGGEELQAEVKVISQNLRFCEEVLRKMKRFTETADTIEWAVEKDKDGFNFEPVSGRPFMSHALMKFGHRRLFLSATFLDAKAFCGAVKIPYTEKTKYIAVPCSFPVENRKVVLVPVGKMGQRDIDKNWPKAVAAINKIFSIHDGERGVVHATSYQIAKRIRDDGRVTPAAAARMLFHESRGRDDTINEFMHKSREDAVLVGVSVTQGYDFKGDMCNFQILLRLPYPFPSKRINMRRKNDPRYYDWRTALTFVQTCGRGNRSATDKCITYVLDARLAKFIAQNRAILPRWFLDAVVLPR